MLGRRASFWVSAAVVAHTLWTSAAPAMAYPLYAAQWHLSHTVTTGIFAIYPIFVVAVLIAFGGLSDAIGRRATMLIALAASALGVLIFAVAPNVVWLFVGRAIMGIGVGLSAGPSTAAVLEFSAPGQERRASSVTTAAQAVGYAAAFLIGGALIQYAPFPTRLSFWLLFVLLVALFSVTWFLPRGTIGTTARRWAFRAPAIPSSLAWTFAVATTAATTAYTHGVLMQSLGAQVAHDLVRSSNVFVNGAALSLFAVSFGIAGIVAKPLAPRTAMLFGAVATMTSMALLAASVALHALPFFLAAVTTAGIGYTLLFGGGLTMINAAAPAQHRGGILSAIYLFGYISLGAVALLDGAIATARGLAFAIDCGAAIMAVLSCATIVLVLSTSSQVMRETTPPAFVLRARCVSETDKG